MTPSEVHAKLTALFPEFIGYWDSPHNYHRDEEGSFTLCGVFSQFWDCFEKTDDEMGSFG